MISRLMGRQPTVDVEIDAVLTALSNERRRAVIDLLGYYGALSLNELATMMAADEHDVPRLDLESDNRKAVYVSLYQSHIPSLEEQGIIELHDGRRSGIIEQGPAFDGVRALLEEVRDRCGGDGL